MKNFLKNLTHKNKIPKSNELDFTEQIVFEDSKLQKLTISLFKTGNDILIKLAEEKSGFEILLDKEKSFLVSMILQNYVSEDNLEKILNTLK